MEFINFFNQDHAFSFFIKVFGIVVSFLYLFYSVVVMRQVESMRKTVTFYDRGYLKLAAHTQILFGVILVFFALFLL